MNSDNHSTDDKAPLHRYRSSVRTDCGSEVDRCKQSGPRRGAAAGRATELRLRRRQAPPLPPPTDAAGHVDGSDCSSDSSGPTSPSTDNERTFHVHVVPDDIVPVRLDKSDAADRADIGTRLGVHRTNALPTQPCADESGSEYSAMCSATARDEHAHYSPDDEQMLPDHVAVDHVPLMHDESGVKYDADVATLRAHRSGLRRVTSHQLAVPLRAHPLGSGSPTTCLATARDGHASSSPPDHTLLDTSCLTRSGHVEKILCPDHVAAVHTRRDQGSASPLNSGSLFIRSHCKDLDLCVVADTPPPVSRSPQTSSRQQDSRDAESTMKREIHSVGAPIVNRSVVAGTVVWDPVATTQKIEVKLYIQEPEDQADDLLAAHYHHSRQRRNSILALSVVCALLAAGAVYLFCSKALFVAPLCAIFDEAERDAAVTTPMVCEACGSGTQILPLGGEMEQAWPRWFRIALYIPGLLWCFQGVAIACDQFMAAIERISSSTVSVWLIPCGGSVRQKFTMNVWNPTIVNLSLMAFGSSAPEILLSVIELFGNSFFSGELGPSTIVGSAAFNLHVIIAVCVCAVPADDIRKVVGTVVFAITSVTSLFAYVWLIVILQIHTPDKVDVWEGLVTFAMFPALLIVAFAADKGWIGKIASGKAITQQVEHKAAEDEEPSITFGFTTDATVEALSTEAEGRLCVKVVASMPPKRTVLVTYILCYGDATMDERCTQARYSGVVYFEDEIVERMICIPLTCSDKAGDSRCFSLRLSDAQFLCGPIDNNNESDNHTELLEILKDRRQVTVNVVKETYPASRPFACNAQAFRAWWEQICAAVYCGGGPEEQSKSGPSAWAVHLSSLFWKLPLAILVPPVDLLGGWPCFLQALVMIGILTMIVGDMASLLGCCMGIPDDITAITFVALGTSVPDTFASWVAAQQDEFADSAIGNVTGSNCVNVFLGLGLPWSIGAFYWRMVGSNAEWLSHLHRGESFKELFAERYPEGGFLVPAGSLGSSVFVFVLTAIACLSLLALRRRKYGGELGGPKFSQMRDASFLVALWLFYIGFSVVISFTGVKLSEAFSR